MDQHAKGDTGISEQRDKSQSAGACSLCFNNAPYVAAFSCGAFNANLMSPLILNRLAFLFNYQISSVIKL